MAPRTCRIIFYFLAFITFFTFIGDKTIQFEVKTLPFLYEKHLLYVQESKHTGAGADEVYEPTLWYFDLLLFTAERETGRPGQSNYGREYEIDADTERNEVSGIIILIIYWYGPRYKNCNEN